MGGMGYSQIISVRNSERVIPLGELEHKWENNVKINV
jgi:hypothetical protein